MHRIPYARGGVVTAAEYNKLADAVNYLLGGTVGPGLEKHDHPGGWVISQAESRLTSKLTTTLQTLAQTQGAEDSDSWDASTNKCAVEWQVITDIQYVSPTLSFRTRTVTGEILKIGAEYVLVITEISAESALVTITTSGPCPV